MKTRQKDKESRASNTAQAQSSITGTLNNIGPIDIIATF
jgi:hypothetical protein